VPPDLKEKNGDVSSENFGGEGSAMDEGRRRTVVCAPTVQNALFVPGGGLRKEGEGESSEKTPRRTAGIGLSRDEGNNGGQYAALSMDVRRKNHPCVEGRKAEERRKSRELFSSYENS